MRSAKADPRRSCILMRSSGPRSRRAGQRVSSGNCRSSASTSQTGGRAAWPLAGVGADGPGPVDAAAPDAGADAILHSKGTKKAECAKVA